MANQLRQEGFTIVKTQHNPELRKTADSYGIKMPFKLINGQPEAL